MNKLDRLAKFIGNRALRAPRGSLRRRLLTRAFKALRSLPCASSAPVLTGRES